MKRSLWFGSILCILSVLPGWLVGTLLGLLFALVNFDMTNHPDFLYLREWFGFETPGLILGWLFVMGIPAFIQGLVAGIVAVAITKNVYVGDRLDIAALIAAGFYLLPLLALAAFVAFRIGLEWDNLHDILQWLGLALGLVLTAHELPHRITRRWL